jgi:hypothetical protein
LENGSVTRCHRFWDMRPASRRARLSCSKIRVRAASIRAASADTTVTPPPRRPSAPHSAAAPAAA